MELSSLSLGAAAIAAIGGAAVDEPKSPVQETPSYVAVCNIKMPMVTAADASKVLAGAKVSAGYLRIDDTIAEPSCQA